MDKLYKEKWIDALRSGKYKQTRFELKTFDNHFCAVGVLCDIYYKDKWIINLIDQSSYAILEEDYDTMMNNLNFNINELITIIEMNDQYLSFDKIANYIEENL